MTLTSRQRWMLYAVAGLLTVLAMVAVEPSVDSNDNAEAQLLPVRTPARTPAVATTASPGNTALMPLPARPFGGAGRSPFGEASANISTAPPSPEALAATAAAAAPPVNTTPTLPFSFLGRWTEHGVTTVYVSFGGRGLPAVAGKPLTSEYFVEAIGERDMRLLHRPSGTHYTLALVAGAGAPPPTNSANAANAAAATEEQN